MQHNFVDVDLHRVLKIQLIISIQRQRVAIVTFRQRHHVHAIGEAALGDKSRREARRRHAPLDSLCALALLPLLREPANETGRVLPTTFDRGNLSLRTTRWRYLRYANGEEELYDLKADPNEWTNLANDPKYAELKDRLTEGR